MFNVSFQLVIRFSCIVVPTKNIYTAFLKPVNRGYRQKTFSVTIPLSNTYHYPIPTDYIENKQSPNGSNVYFSKKMYTITYTVLISTDLEVVQYASSTVDWHSFVNEYSRVPYLLIIV